MKDQLSLLQVAMLLMGADAEADYTCSAIVEIPLVRFIFIMILYNANIGIGRVCTRPSGYSRRILRHNSLGESQSWKT